MVSLRPVTPLPNEHPPPAAWIGVTQAARILGVDRSTVYRSLVDPKWCEEWWGEEGTGWRIRPLVRRKVYQVSLKRAEALAATRP